ncbi:MAG: hypothetical protein WDW36_002619 [Sanguina aurantia]
MAAASISQGDRAFIEEEYELALASYTEAVNLDPTNSRILDARANTLIKLGQYMEASEDASKAIDLEPGFSKAYLRKGVALFNLEEYESAKEVFEAGQKQAGDAAFKTWIRKCNAELEGEEAEQAIKPPSTQRAPPAPSPPTAAAAPTPPSAAPTSAATHANGSSSSSPIHSHPVAQEAVSAPQQPTATSSPAPPEEPDSKALAPSAPPALDAKYRHQFYQLQSKATVDIYAKALPRDRVRASFQPTHLSVSIVDGAGVEEYRLEVELFGKVEPSACRVEVLRSKIEITMAKIDAAQWGGLEAPAASGVQLTSRPDVSASNPATKAPKDWRKVDSHIAELESKDDDQRRAMMKSFTESNGTVLSTNWEDIGKKKTECTPPDGMQVKKWSEKE